MSSSPGNVSPDISRNQYSNRSSNLSSNPPTSTHSTSSPSPTHRSHLHDRMQLSPTGYVPVRSHSDDEIGIQQEQQLQQHQEQQQQQQQQSYEPNELDMSNYPPAPPVYYRQNTPMRIANYGKLILVLFAVVSACLPISAATDFPTPSTILEPGIDVRSVAESVLAAMNRSADPCENFYEYACGSWLQTTRIPTDKAAYSKSSSTLYDRIQLMLKRLLQIGLQTSKTPSKIGMFYKSCLDQMGSGGLNTLYLQSFRNSFRSLHSSKDYVSLLAQIHLQYVRSLFGVSAGIDRKNTSRYALYISQGGLGLRHRDDYLKNSDRELRMREKYLELMYEMLKIAERAGLIPRQRNHQLADQILKLETKLANLTLPPEDRRDPEKLYNKIAITAIPGALLFNEYMRKLRIDKRRLGGSVIIDNVPFFQLVSGIISKTNTSSEYRKILRGYSAFHLVRAAAIDGLLGEKAYRDNFKFEQHLYGVKKPAETWKRCQSLTSSYLGEGLGKAFVKSHFSESRKKAVVALSKEISKSLAATIKSAKWMDSKTRKEALEKLDMINQKVGYSEKLDSYDDVQISPLSFQKNVASALAYNRRKGLRRLGNPIDKTQWSMRPHEVNAYYSATRNEMVFPAGILQQPFFSDGYPDAMNYGGIGAVIGHEMSHGFDDKGRQYDKYGMLRQWWSHSSIARYKAKAKCFVDLYNTYKPRDIDTHIIGNLTLGENIADTTGVNVAYHAFKRKPSNTEDGIPPPNVLLAGELTNDQLFFVAYAQTWCTSYRPETLKDSVMSDSHAPGRFRVRGPLSQSEIFAKAFSCRNGSRYNPTTRCELW